MMFRLAAALALGLAVTGCTALGQISAVTERLDEATEPVQLYLLTPAETFAADLPTLDRQLIVEEPIAASHLDTDRIAIMPAPLVVEYLPEVRWADRAPVLVQRLLVESLETTEKVASVTGQRVAVASDFLLLPDLREFQAVASDVPGAPLVPRVRLNLKIVDDDSGLIVASESFRSEAVAAAAGPVATVAAFDEALGEVLRQAVEWGIRQIADWEPPEEPYPLEG